MRILQLQNIHHTFKSQFVKVQAIAHIVVRRYSFRIIVNHHAAPSFFTNSIQSLHTAPVKFYGRTDTISTGPQYDNGFMVAQVMNIICHTAISKIQIIGLCRIFGCQSIDLLHYRKNTRLFTMFADIKNTILHITFVADGTGNLEIRETLNLGFTKQFVWQIGYLFVIISPAMQFFGSLHNIHQFLKEPFINLSQFVYLIDGVAGTKSLRDNKNSFISRFAQSLVDVGNNQLLVFYKSVHSLSNHAEPFLDSFFKSTTDSHHLTDRFHRRSQFFIYTVEFTQIPTWNLTYNIIQCRFEESRSSLCYRVLQVEESVTQSQFSRNESQRITRCLRCQSR